MVKNGFPDIPQRGDYVKFTGEFFFVAESSGTMFGGSGLSGAGSSGGFTTTSITISSGDNSVPAGTIGQVLGAEVVSGMLFDTAAGYLLYIAVFLENKLHILKFKYEIHPGMLEIIPNTTASRVLYGSKV